MPTAMAYHMATDHTREHLSGRELDWANRPGQFKHYPAEVVDRVLPLPRCAVSTAQSLPLLLQGAHALAVRPTLQQLANILALAAGITQTRMHGAEPYHLRSWPSAGGLFPCELYLALGPAWQDRHQDEAVDPGLWHYQSETHSLHLLRHGDALGVAAMAAGLPETAPGSGARLAGVACITGIVHRSAWKYGERAYRYALLDAGHLAENLLVALGLEGFSAMWAVDFVDDALNALLGLDGRREFCLLAVPFFLGTMADSFSTTAAPVGPLEEFADRAVVEEASRCAPVEKVWPEMLDLHRAGVIETRFIGRQESPECPAPGMLFRNSSGPAQPLQEATGVFAERVWPPVSRVVLSRRSHRRFAASAVPAASLQALCHLLCTRSLQDRGSRHLGTVLGIRDVGGMEDGLYLLDREQRALACLQTEAPHEALARACLGQFWMARASVLVCFVANLHCGEDHWGPRRYRALGLAAGRLGERVYLAATSLGWGACGIGAFFDDEAAAVLGLVPEARLLYAVAAGPVAQTGQ